MFLPENRTYYPLWKKLKELPPDAAFRVGVSIISNRVSHNRIIRMVGKEKWLDIGFKLSIEPLYAELTYKKEFSKLTFFLERRAWKRKKTSSYRI